MTDVFDLLVQAALGILLTAWVVRRDMRRSGPERLRRAWNDASFWSAVVAFGPLSIPVHFARTRRSIGGFLLGVVWAAMVLLSTSLVGAAIDGLWGAG